MLRPPVRLREQQQRQQPGPRQALLQVQRRHQQALQQRGLRQALQQQERGQVLQRGQEPAQERVLPSCHKQPEQRQQPMQPERETWSFNFLEDGTKRNLETVWTACSCPNRAAPVP